MRAIVGSSTKPEEAIEKMYLAALSRRPTADETDDADRVRRQGRARRRRAYGDILWAVLNSSEFTMVR